MKRKFCQIMREYFPLETNNHSPAHGKSMDKPGFSRWWYVGGVAFVAAWLICFEYHSGWNTPDRPLTDFSSETTAVVAKSPDQAPNSELRTPRITEELQSSQSAPPRPLRREDRLLKMLRRRLDVAGAMPNEALLKFRSSEAQRDFLDRAARNKLTVLGRLDPLQTARVRYDQLDQLRAAIANEANIYEGVDVNYIVKIPDWPFEESRAGGVGTASFDGVGFLPAIGATADRSAWGEGVTVAVIDTGVEQHATFGDGQITHMDLVNDGQPFNGHGTAMASLIAGQDEHAPGVAPASYILDVRVADSDGISSSFKLAEGIVHAANAGAQVMNISLGSYADAAVVRDAVSYAESKNAVVIGAAGNDQTSNQLAYPAAISSVISVGGVDASYQQAYCSNSGTDLDVTAPAVGIQSAFGQDLVVFGDGTSQAAAITSGVVAYGLSSGSTTASGASDWLKQNVLSLSLPPERGGVGMVQVQPR